MVDLYVKLIINKRRNFDAVPDKFKEQVETRLFSLGYDTNGDPIE